MGTGKILLKVPQPIYWNLEGMLRPGVMAKDIILHIIGELSVDGATYMALQFGGDGASALTMEDRMTIANMAIEAGGKNGIFEFDNTTRRFVDERCKLNGTKSDYTPVERDKDEKFFSSYSVDVNRLEPTVACHPNPGMRKLARELRTEKLDRAYLGSCTGGKTSDFYAAAEILRGREVRIPTFAVPATPEVEGDMKTLTIGGKTLWQIFEDAGVLMSANPGCAACLGGPIDTFGRMNQAGTCISTTNRNFPGRMGAKEARIFLASPATVAASAVTGSVADPRDYLQ
jgi:3-isopropylmalate/(R)-2-methylmalate dehydratase large subunit